ncbi:hypothetical protein [Rickettsiella endosymbiont of Dermanyssus gallinae]|uniref:hypothetical protein n=1 Tax=Rickettsiella endosymbiont of Dermanyssus gallinae TaxID=2856608 RepID=UPI001C52B433|nr:hypothetical protein [Rickettsiella endosymbiont of Dermanyssus gallinae]
MPILNSDLNEKCYNLTPLKLPHLNQLQSLPKDWLPKLAALCKVKIEHFNRHIKTSHSCNYVILLGNTTLSLTNALQLIYLRLSDLNATDSHHTAMILKLQVSRYAPEEFRPSCPRNSFA